MAAAPTASTAANSRVRASLASLPLAFEANQGQTDPQVKYMARGNGYTVFLTPNETVFALNSSSSVSRTTAQSVTGKRKTAPKVRKKEVNAAIHMHLVGANARAQIAASDEMPGRSNYFIGNDRSQWHANVAQYARVDYRDVYPGVDMAFHGAQKQLEFDFIVAPGATATPIRLGVTGVNRIATDDSGNLILAASAGDVLLHRPVAYQEKNGSRQPVDARFRLEARNQVSLELGNYDHSRELVIDPSVTYSTYLGGVAEDDAYAIAVDGSGNAFITGQTKSAGFPTKNALHSSSAGGFDVFVTEISPTGTLLYSTFIGSSSDDSGNAIAIDGSGDVFVAGGADASNFPIVGGYQTVFGGGVDAFVFELNASGSALVYSTFLGGSGTDVATGLVLDSGGNAYIVGSTTSNNFPPKNPIISSIPGASAGFVTKLNSSGNALVYSTYLGGSNADFAVAVAVDGSGNAYVTGGTNSPDFPTTSGVVQTTCGSDGNCNGALYDAFVTVINSAGSGYVYSTFLGGEASDEGFGIAVDGSKNAYVIGSTDSSTKFPLKAALQPTFGGNTSDAFVTKIKPDGTALIYSTYLGGSGNDTGVQIALDSNNNAYVTGQTGSTNFPLASATQSQNNGQNDAFVSEISSSGAGLVFSTYLGGKLNENTSAANGGGAIGAIAVDSAGANIYVAGNTTSTDFPTTSPLQGSNNGGTDAFVASYTQSTSGTFTVANGPLSNTSGSPGVSATSTITVGSVNGFNSAVTLTCAVTPAVSKGPTCSLNPSTPVTPPAGGSVTATLTVSSTAASAMLEHPSNGRSSGMLYAMILPVFGITLLGAGMGSAGSRRKKLFGFLILGMVLAALLVMPACGGGSGSGGGGGGGGGGTPAGTYTITVSGSGNGAVVTGTPALSLTIN